MKSSTELYGKTDFTSFLSRAGINGKTQAGYISSMNNLFKYLLKVKKAYKELDYDLIDIIEFLKATQLKGRVRGTLLQCVQAINAYSHFINKNLYIELRDIPLYITKEYPQREFVILSKEAQKSMYYYAQKTWKKRDIAILLLMIETGIKVSEIIALEKNDLSEENSMCYIRINSTIPRVVPITRILHDQIILSYSARNDKDSAMFINQRGTRVKEVSIQNIRRSYHLSLEILRDTYIHNHLIRASVLKGIGENQIRILYGEHTRRFIDFRARV
ncbi:tyrosine-type recombinase/integrase [Bacillus sp. AFS040349]|uniref:tyrosine-type recombinase/integrase n=1 Tax=Bacillus sp. AFS040349 TaxID=2033502 RepID=UPI000BFB6B12|nr:tyrosine-type recombinase/integrase [Bacillus sp. AFS040349]PGT83277.1 hypothetical protein COD11_13155 [Bacillus sp. AFS040349]